MEYDQAFGVVGGMKTLASLLNDIPFESLPAEWAEMDLGRFSRQKTLWDYQQEALRNALKALWKYHQAPPAERKEAFYQWYADNDITLEDLSLGRKRENSTLLGEFYPLEDDRLPYRHVVNRMGFWMATASGKTLVIVKLIEMLWQLMRRGCIEKKNLLVLTHREDLLQQLRTHVDEYNRGGGELYIRLHELKEYPEVKRSLLRLLGSHEISVFVYRSDNLNNEQKERIIDFHNYDNNGNWYVLLDEAHKGDKEDSKRQHIYSILSREGFLFNFSATFTDPRDILTTAAEFNLASFIQAGYGKHIAILQQENRAFKRDEDYTDEEKQKIVLQSLLVLAYLHKARTMIQEGTQAEMYHRPLLLALVNSVNTDDADLKIFFAQLERIAHGGLSDETFRRAKIDLWKELQAEPEWLYEETRCKLDPALFNGLTKKDILREVFNAETPGEIEVLTRPSNEKELAFKLKSSDRPFALIRIGNTAEWLKHVLVGYEFVSGFESESFFEKLNSAESEITLLMGSRSFYEGWDSNRPNVITFINIGTGTDAKKFILQSVGRGVRLEPLPGKRKRMAALRNAGEVDEVTFKQAKPWLPSIETLFIFGTNRAALDSVFKELDHEKEKPEGVELALAVNKEAIGENPLLIPVYQPAQETLMEQSNPRKFDLPASDLLDLQHYVEYLNDERLLLAHHDLSPRQIENLKRTLGATGTYFSTQGGRRFGSMGVLIPRLARYFDLHPKEFEDLKTLEDEINHHQHIRVILKDIEELRKKIKAVQDYRDPEAEKQVLKERLKQGTLDIDTYTAEIEKIAHTSGQETFTPPGKSGVQIKNIAAHYYLPLLVAEDEKIDYIRHIITVESERKFIEQLEIYLKEAGNQFGPFDWWMFSKTDESLDRIVIPYYDRSTNRMREFHPDFIFWLKCWDKYTILFVDPKGTKNTDYEYKVDGYEQIFLDPQTHEVREFLYKGLKVQVRLAMYNPAASQVPMKYQDYWYDSPREILEKLQAG